MNAKKLLALLCALALVFPNVPRTLADDTDIFGANIQPNVMLLIDSSQSMDDEVQSTPYDPIVTYNTPLTYDTTKVYQKFTRSRDCSPQPRPCYKVYKDSIADVPDANAQTALSTTGYWSGRISGSRVHLFYGNYLNYLACSTCSAVEKKIVIAKRVLTNVINNVNGVRFGAMKFKSGGGLVMEPVREMTATNRTTLINSINNMTLTSAGTVTGEQLRDAGQYYKGLYSGYSSPIELACQPNFAIVISDGLYTGIDPWPVAADLFSNPNTNDHSSSFPGTQNVIVHTVGFALSQGDQDAGGLVALQDTARSGGGSFYTADNSAQLEEALADAISQVMAATFAFATPVVPTTSTTGVTRAYLAEFQSDPVRPFWRGFLKAYERDSNGLIPVDNNGIPLDSALAWDAGQKLALKTADSRTIYTSIAGARKLFVKSDSAITPGLLGVSTQSERDKIIDFIRGIDVLDEDRDSNTSEERPWKLGDIFHSTPVLVTPPSLPSTDSSNVAFKQDNASRTTVLLAGANDGMLHAFRESDGEELWTYIPPDLLSRLKELTGSSGGHPFYVDSSPIAVDIQIDGSWKTIVVFGLRRGGKSYHALDITDTANPIPLWSFADSKMGETWSEPAVGKVNMAGNSVKYVAFIGGGYDTPQNNDSGKVVFAIDLATGAKLWEYYSDGSSGDRQYMNFSLAANPTAVDLDGNGFVDRVYIGDVGGQLWRFDVSNGSVTNWTGKRLFAADPSQPNPPPVGEYYPAQAIYASPTLALDGSRNLWVYFGTGDRNHPLNASTSRFYGIKDNTDMTNGSYLSESSPGFVNVSSGSPPFGQTITQGWYIIFSPSGSGEKVLSTAEVFNKVVLFSTFTPTSTASCAGGGGEAKLYAVNLISGDAAVNLTSGEAVSPGQSAASFARAVGTGIPSKPVIVTDSATGSSSAIVGTTNRQLFNNPIPPIALRRLLGWREVF